MNKYNIRTLIVCVSLLMTTSLFAQEKEKENKLKRELTLEKEYDPTVGDAQKINLLPQIEVRKVRRVAIDYSNFSRTYETPRMLTMLPSEHYQTKMDLKRQIGYLNVAAGTRGNLNGDFGVMPINNGKTSWLFYGTHRSVNDEVRVLSFDNKGNLKINDNLLGTEFKTKFKPVSLSINAAYGFNTFNYPGTFLVSSYSHPTLSDDISPLKLYDNKKNKDKTFLFQTNVRSREAYSFMYEFGLNFTRVDRQIDISPIFNGLAENHFGVNGSVGFPILSDSKFFIDADLNYYMYDVDEVADGLREDILTQKFGNQSLDDHFETTITPHVDFVGGTWKLSVGANLFAISGDNKKFGIAPRVLGELAISNRSKLYLNMDGGLESNNVYQLSQQYRYLDPLSRGIPSRVLADATLGLRLGIGEMSWLNVFGGYRIAKNELFYGNTVALRPLNEVLNGENFMGSLNVPILFLQQADADRMKIGAEFNLNVKEKLHLALHGVYYKWNMKDLENPYGKPNLELGLVSKFKPTEKLSLNMEYLLLANRKGVYFPIYTDEYYLDYLPHPVIEKKHYHELNAEVNYQLIKPLSIYLRADNLLFKNSQEYYLGFPTQGFRLLGGLNLKF